MAVFVFDDVPFKQRLAETIAWCRRRVRANDPKGSLRSMENQPSILPRDRASALRSVAGYRGNYAGELPPISGSQSLLGGRLLVYFPDAELSDGAAEAASGGFFDVHNAPPWDTWIALADDGSGEEPWQQSVVCWVPAEFITSAQRGMSVNPEQCIVWLEDAGVRLRNAVRELLDQ